MHWRKSIFPILGITIFLMIISCDISILSDADTLRLQDTIAPVITLFSPQEDGHYAATVIAEGVVTDAADSSGHLGKVTAFFYRIEGTAINRQVSLQKDGSFQFSFGTENMTGSITLTLTAGDWNTNTGVLSITLKQGAFPDLNVVPGNQQATLSWQPVPFAGNYTIYYKKGAVLSSIADYDQKIENAVSPKVVDNLQNGTLYSFIIQANSTTGGNNLSGLVQAIPLSPFTFAPQVTGAYKQIIVEWPQSAGAAGSTMKFVVKRSQAKQGLYTDISGPIADTRYIDTNVMPGIHYYYKVMPSLEGTIESAPNSGECAPFPPFLTTAGIYKTPFLARGISISGHYAFIADSESGLLIVDISYPETPVLTGSCRTSGYTHAVAVAGNFAYLAADTAGLQIINAENPAAPEWVSTYNTGGNAVDVSVSNGYAYIADSGAGLAIVDVSNPRSPVPASEYTIENGSAEGITLVDNKAYIAFGKKGLQILDISDPLHPLPAGNCQTPSWAHQVAVKDGFAYVADGAAGLQIINPGNAQQAPALYGACATGGEAVDIAVEGTLALIADKIAGLILVDISDKFFPVQAAIYSGDSGGSTIESAGAVVIQDRYAYVSCYKDGIRILDIARPGAPAPEAVYNNAETVWSAAVQGDYALLAAGNAGLEIADLTNKGNPGFLASLPSTGIVRGIAICGDYAFLTGVDIGLQIVCFRNPAAPVLTGVFELAGITAGASIRGDYAYITCWKTANYNPNSRTGLQIVDIAHPENPRLVGSYMESAGFAWQVTLAGNYAYLMNQEAGITILDITDNKLPGKVKTINTNGSAISMTIKNNTTMIANGAAGLWAANIINPGEPLFNYDYKTGACAQDIRLVNDYAFVANGQGGLLILNIADLQHPFKTGASVQGAPDTKSIVVSGSYGFLSQGTGGLVIIDLWTYD